MSVRDINRCSLNIGSTKRIEYFRSGVNEMAGLSAAYRSKYKTRRFISREPISKNSN